MNEDYPSNANDYLILENFSESSLEEVFEEEMPIVEITN
jgi:hypothetical protein